MALLMLAAMLAWLRWGIQFGWLAAWLIAVNVTTFVAYFYDKRAAGQGWLRVPEQLLHALAIVGGSPAALLAQSYLRHKTVKSSFRAVFWIILTAQAMLVTWYFWSGGSI